jgi:Co/Zn/Cd efflux system component
LISLVLFVIEVWAAVTQKSAALFALSIRAFTVNLMSFCSNLLIKKSSTSHFSYGYVRVRLVLAFSVCVFGVLCGFLVGVNSVQRMLFPPPVEERNLRLWSIVFAVFDLFEVLRIGLVSSSERLYRGIEPSSVVFYLMATASTVISSILIEHMELYVLDAVAEAAVGLTIIDFALLFLSELLESLLLSVGRNDMQIIGQIANSLGTVNASHVWAASDDLNVATFAISRGSNASSKSFRLTQVITELQKLKIRDLTLQLTE